MSFFEVGMLVCFAFSWPVNIYKSITSKTAKGKSPVFLIVVIIGYICGIFHKFFYDYNWIVLLYILNALMVAIDLFLTLRNKKRDEV